MSTPIDTMHKMTRREALAIAAGTAGALAAGPALAETTAAPAALKGRIHHSVCRWCYGKMSLEELCRQAGPIGIEAIDLLGENEWSVPAQFGLTCSMATGITTLNEGWNQTAKHDDFVRDAERLMPLARQAGLKNMISFSGIRDGVSDAEGLRNCAKGIKRIMPLTEKLGLTLHMELLNSKVDHKDYLCDHTAWGVALAKEVGSDRFKLLYDIYHMQIMEGDIIRTLRDNIAYLGHFHTGGVPGRNEIDETQELQYRTILQAIADTGFKGYVGQEFIPKRDPMTSLRQAVQICDV